MNGGTKTLFFPHEYSADKSSEVEDVRHLMRQAAKMLESSRWAYTAEERDALVDKLRRAAAR